MNSWIRHTPLDAIGQSEVAEQWIYAQDEQTLASFQVQVRIGKPLDIGAFKGSPLADIQAYSATLAQNARSLYKGDHKPQKVKHCPCCKANSFSPALSAFDVDYVRCASCGHVFVQEQLSSEIIKQFFEDADSLAMVYTEPATQEFRLKNIVQPKLDWVLQTYQRHYEGKSPLSVIDVGAGGGHFVEICRRANLHASGYEINQSARNYAHNAWGLELLAEDYLTSQPDHPIDIITFWGLLEYTPEPRHFLDKARTQLNSGLLIVEVPRFEAISSISQQLQPQYIARHLDPTSHLNCFSDSSLATALYQTGFEPVAAWYFGMDAYELIAQMALRTQSAKLYDDLIDWIPALQAAFDAAHLCDDFIIAARPLGNS